MKPLPIWLFFCSIALLFGGCSFRNPKCNTPPGALPTHSTHTFRDLAFVNRGGHKLKLDVYLPQTPTPKEGYPLIICFHGGGWAIKGRRDAMFLRPLTERGFALASVQYRLSGEAPFPAQIEDSREAVHWLIKNAERFHFDSARIGTFGPSAGGHLALLVGLSESEQFVPGGSAPLPRGTIGAICAMYPPTDLIGIIPKKNRATKSNLVALLLGGSVVEKMNLAVVGSPITHVSKNSPPILLIHGDADTLVPLEQSRHLHHLMKMRGARSQLIVFKGKPHGFSLNKSSVSLVGDFYRNALKVSIPR